MPMPALMVNITCTQALTKRLIDRIKNGIIISSCRLNIQQISGKSCCLKQVSALLTVTSDKLLKDKHAYMLVSGGVVTIF